MVCRSLTETCKGTDKPIITYRGVCNYFKLSGQRDTYQGFSRNMIVSLCVDEERCPSRDMEGVIRGRARQDRMKLGQTGICALDTTTSERGVLSFTRHHWKQDS